MQIVHTYVNYNIDADVRYFYFKLGNDYISLEYDEYFEEIFVHLNIWEVNEVHQEWVEHYCKHKAPKPCK